jgi:SIR2-like domain
MKMDIEESIIHALRGDAVLFTGAGFSYKATNSVPPPDNEVPNARQFAAQLASQLSGSSSVYDLPIISQYYSKIKGEHHLLNELSRRFTVTSVQPFHVEIARVSWRRVYTTNYDNCFEFAALQSGKDWVPITLEAAPTAAPQRCVHLNGYVANLNIKNLHSQIKLTHSSYSADAFSTSKWSQQLRQDFNNAKAVFFVGYSMSDIGIASVLFSSPDLFSRTFFIVAPAEDAILVSPLDNYGYVHKIGVEDFAYKISNCVLPKDVSSTYEYSWLNEYNSDLTPRNPGDTAGIDLITLGILNSEHVAWTLADPKANYVVDRSEIR